MHEARRAFMEHERAVRQIVHRRLVMSLAARGRVDALRVELGVDGVGAGLVRMDRAPDLHEPHVVLSPAEGARAMAGGERGRLVQEEQLREPAGLHHRRPVPPAERQPAGDPALAVEPPPDDAGIVVQAAAVPVDGATCRIGDQVAERCHPVPSRHRAVRSRRTLPRPRAPGRPSTSRATPRTRRGAARPRRDRTQTMRLSRVIIRYVSSYPTPWNVVRHVAAMTRAASSGCRSRCHSCASANHSSVGKPRTSSALGPAP